MVDYNDLVNARIECQSMEMLMSPFSNFCSGPRLNMFCKNLAQAVLLPKGEHPYIFTGYETIFSKYSLDHVKADRDMEIFDRIPKYDLSQGVYPLHVCPNTTVVYKYLNERKCGYFDIPTYTLCSNKFGYDNVIVNKDKCSGYVSKDTEFAHSPIRVGNQYGIGVNLNTVYISILDDDEDAIYISDRAAAKLESTSFVQVQFFVSAGTIPLNLYGSDDLFKFMPDIGEVVNEEGILAAFRTPNKESFLSDVSPKALKNTTLHDQIISAPAGAKIVDVDVTVNPRTYNDLKSTEYYSQVERYRDGIIMYYERIVQAYQTLKKEGYEADKPFNTLVTKAMKHLDMYNVQKKYVTPTYKDVPIDLISVSVVYRVVDPCKPGYKITGNDGSKGVISHIVPAEFMPNDKFGQPVDVIVTYESPVNRLNMAQLYEQLINYISVHVAVQATEINDVQGVEAAYKHIVDYVKRFNINQAALMEQKGNKRGYKESILADAKDMHIWLNIIPFMKTITPENVKQIAEDYHADPERISFSLCDHENKEIGHYAPEAPVIVGSRYWYLLYKKPELKGTAMSCINQFNVPVKGSKSLKQSSPIPNTPSRDGNDETRASIIAAGDDATARLHGIHSSAHSAANMLGRHILNSPEPELLEKIPMTDQQILDDNTIIKAIKHTLNVIGVSIDKKETNDVNEV